MPTITPQEPNRLSVWQPTHECRSGAHCVNTFTGIDKQKHGAFTERANTLCYPCQERAFKAVQQLPHDHEGLSGVSTNPTRTSAAKEKVKRTPGRGVPINLDAYELMAQIDDETVRWAIRLDPDLDELPTNTHRRVQQCVTVITRRFPALIEQPTRTYDIFVPHPDGGDELGTADIDGVDAAQRLSSLHRRAQRILGHTEEVSYLNHERCPLCLARKLVAHHDEDRITCHGCHATWSEAGDNNQETAA